MFTIKIVRVKDGVHHARGVEALSYEIVDDSMRHAVIGHLANGDEAYIPVRDKYDQDGSSELADVVFVENSNGKTTDVVRA